LLIGVADWVDDLVAGHQSIERALVIPAPSGDRFPSGSSFGLAAQCWRKAHFVAHQWRPHDRHAIVYGTFRARRYQFARAMQQIHCRDVADGSLAPFSSSSAQVCFDSDNDRKSRRSDTLSDAVGADNAHSWK